MTPPGTGVDARARRLRTWTRFVALLIWTSLAALFWLAVQASGEPPLRLLASVLDGAAGRSGAAFALLLAYALRPLLLMPITLLNVTMGFVAGPVLGLPLALVGTLLSSTVGYLVGRALAAGSTPERLALRVPFGSALRRHVFVAVTAAGLMQLHADVANLPAGVLRVRFPSFLAGVAVGNLLGMSTAVLAGAAVEGELVDASLALDGTVVAIAASMFLVSVGIAVTMRRRWRRAERLERLGR